MSIVSPVRHTVTHLLHTARRYAAHPDDWPVAARFNPERRWYHRLADSPDSEVWLLSWLPGQDTDLHDHGGSSGAFVVVEGAITEYTVATAPGGGPPRLGERTLTAGQDRSFGPRHIHRIANTTTRPAVSLHVYGPALREMTRYRVEEGQLVVSAVERAGADW